MSQSMMNNRRICIYMRSTATYIDCCVPRKRICIFRVRWLEASADINLTITANHVDAWYKCLNGPTELPKSNYSFFRRLEIFLCLRGIRKLGRQWFLLRWHYRLVKYAAWDFHELCAALWVVAEYEYFFLIFLVFGLVYGVPLRLEFHEKIDVHSFEGSCFLPIFFYNVLVWIGRLHRVDICVFQSHFSRFELFFFLVWIQDSLIRKAFEMWFLNYFIRE